MGGLDLEKKVASHVQGFLAMAQAQTTKDAERRSNARPSPQLQSARIKELTGDRSAGRAVPRQPGTRQRADRRDDAGGGEATRTTRTQATHGPILSLGWA
jgi:hypothetical protein